MTSSNFADMGSRSFNRLHTQLQLRLDLHRDVEWQGADADGDARMVADLGPGPIHQSRELGETWGWRDRAINAQPRRDPVEILELFLEAGQDADQHPTGCLLALLGRNLGADPHG